MRVAAVGPGGGAGRPRRRVREHLDGARRRVEGVAAVEGRGRLLVRRLVYAAVGGVLLRRVTLQGGLARNGDLLDELALGPRWKGLSMLYSEIKSDAKSGYRQTPICK